MPIAWLAVDFASNSTAYDVREKQGLDKGSFTVKGKL